MMCFGLSGCSRHKEVQPGYFEECYGGREKYYDPNVMAIPTVVVTLTVTESQWPALRESLSTFAGQHNLRVFDTSVSRTDVRMIEIFACSDRGIRVYATQRVWDPPIPTGLPADRLDVNLHCFTVSDECAALGPRVEAFFRQNWPEVVDVKHRQAS
jgi:hypothetical protein